MTDLSDTRPTPMGVYDKPDRDGLTAAEVIALILSVLWLLGTGSLFLFLRDPGQQPEMQFDVLNFVMVLLAIFMPVALMWVAAMVSRSARTMRSESRRIEAAIDTIRVSFQPDLSGTTGATAGSISRKLDEIAAAQRKTEASLATFHSIRGEAPSRPEPPAKIEEPGDGQPSLPLDNLPEDSDVDLPRDVYLRALNFPETAEDEDGFTALRHALKDRQTAALIQAAQDVLTLLSQDGIYMDDLSPDMARPETWRRFANGERGRVVAALGGVRDRSSLALTAGRMRQDPVFRDAAHHFIRIFDRMFVEFEKTASDQEITELSETRTARAFMLLGRVAGTFN
ncbi:hypothetical protein ACRARG_08755 [Pseudooceanicola sp. C21-150M6]|uniref:hypothetical protein n=1 Tax=Pseudooceanicola sp. C21-150M6 TaxID=3434355 RepID=UPI003D7FCFE7